MNNYNAVIDRTMIRNVFATNLQEAVELFSVKMVLYLLFLGVLPSLGVYRVEVKHGPWKTELVSRVKIIALSLAVILLSVFVFSKFYTSFLRSINPCAIGRIRLTCSIPEICQRKIQRPVHCTPAHRPRCQDPPTDTDRELIIVVVGGRVPTVLSAAIARQSLLKKRCDQPDECQACGTSWRFPVLYVSMYARDSYSEKKGRRRCTRRAAPRQRQHPLAGKQLRLEGRGPAGL